MFRAGTMCRMPLGSSRWRANSVSRSRKSPWRWPNFDTRADVSKSNMPAIVSCWSMIMRIIRQKFGRRWPRRDLVVSLGAGNIHEQLSILAAELVVAEKLKAIVGEEGEVRLHEPMAKHTTLRVGGPAQFWIEPRAEEAFAELIRFCRRENLPLFVIGRGSNLLVRDGGITGVVVHPCGGAFDDITVKGNEITAGVGAKLKHVAYAGRDAGR